MPRISPLMTQRARALRTSRTEAEALIWARLHTVRPRFTRQLPVGNYIVDLACRKARLVVEFDGGQHAECARDVVRTAFLEGLGWTVLRFWNSDVFENADGVAEAILLKLGELGWPTHPRPLPSREGRRRRSAEDV
jgi:BirA family biotin operon repressor/biotin-[acetyl-CoA-carboxylase] ligase